MSEELNQNVTLSVTLCDEFTEQPTPTPVAEPEQYPVPLDAIELNEFDALHDTLAAAAAGDDRVHNDELGDDGYVARPKKHKKNNKKAPRGEAHVLSSAEAGDAVMDLRQHFKEAPPKKQVPALFRSAGLLSDIMAKRGVDEWKPPEEGKDFFNCSSLSLTPLGRALDLYSPFKKFNPANDKYEITPVNVPLLGSFVTVAGALFALAGVYRRDDTIPLSDETLHDLRTTYAGRLSRVTHDLRLISLPGTKKVMCDILWMVLQQNPAIAEMLKNSADVPLRCFYVTDQGVERSSMHESWMVELYSICRVYLQNEVECPDFDIPAEETLLPPPRPRYSYGRRN